MDFFKKHFKVKKGQRSDLQPELAKLKQDRDDFLDSIPRDTRTKLSSLKIMISALHPEKSEEKLINERLIVELKVRIKKLMYCDVNVDDLNGMDEVDRILLDSANGSNFYQKILGTYRS